jgi:hypothetical protein
LGAESASFGCIRKIGLELSQCLLVLGSMWAEGTATAKFLIRFAANCSNHHDRSH